MTAPVLFSRAPETAVALQRVAELEAQAIAREAEIARLEGAIAGLHAETTALQAALHLMRTSLSWRISAPIRTLGGIARTLIIRQPALARAVRKMRERW